MGEHVSLPMGIIVPIFGSSMYEDARLHMNSHKAFALVLRQKRLTKGLTQSDLASLAGLTSRYIRNLEAGRSSPTLDTLFGLACALEAKAHDIVASVEEELDAAAVSSSD